MQGLAWQAPAGRPRRDLEGVGVGVDGQLGVRIVVWVAVVRSLGAGHVQMPELPRRWLSTRCVSTMPTASMSANMVVGPTKRKPFRRSALDRAMDSGEVVGTSAMVVGVGVASGWKDQMKSGSPPSARSARVAEALSIVARI